MTRTFYARNNMQETRRVPSDNHTYNRPPNSNFMRNPINNWYSNRNNRSGGYHHRYPRTELRRRPAQYAIPPEYFTITKEHFRIVKSVHHQNQVNLGLPPSLKAKSTILQSSINPAFKNNFFDANIEEITNNWRCAVLAALKEHYAAVINESIRLISRTDFPSALLETSINTVSKWAKRQLGHKLKDEELDDALNLIRCHQKLTESTFSDPLPSTTPTARSSYAASPVNRGYDILEDKATQTDRGTDNSEIPYARVRETRVCDSEAQTFQSSADATNFLHFDSPPPGPSLRSPHQEAAASSRVIPEAETTETTAEPQSSQSDVGIPEDAGAVAHGVSLSQTTLLGSFVAERPRGPRAISSLEQLDFSKKAIVMGDSNFCDFQADDVSVLADRFGHLSFFKQLFQKIDVPYPNVKVFILCISLHDRNNLPSTNFVVFRNIMHSARKVFPTANLFVLLCGLPTNCTNTEANNLNEFFDLIRSRVPGSCTIIDPPENFTANGAIWNKSTKVNVTNTLKDFLC